MQTKLTSRNENSFKKCDIIDIASSSFEQKVHWDRTLYELRTTNYEYLSSKKKKKCMWRNLNWFHSNNNSNMNEQWTTNEIYSIKRIHSFVPNWFSQSIDWLQITHQWTESLFEHIAAYQIVSTSIQSRMLREWDLSWKKNNNNKRRKKKTNINW